MAISIYKQARTLRRWENDSRYNLNPTALLLIEGGTLAGSATVVPDGSTTGYDVKEDGSTGLHRIFGDLGWVGAVGTYYAGAIYVRQGTRRYLEISLGGTLVSADFLTFPGAVFDLQTGTIVQQHTGLTRASIEAAPHGWYRCEVVGPALTTQNGYYTRLFVTVSADGDAVFDGSYTGVLNDVAFSYWKASVKLLPDGLPELWFHDLDVPTDVAVKRASLVSTVFGGGGLPVEVGTLSATALPVLPLDGGGNLNITGLATCKKISFASYATTRADWGAVEPYLLLTPLTPIGKAMLVCPGHVTTFGQLRLGQIAHDLLVAGWTVLLHMMPILTSTPHTSGPIDVFCGPQIICINTLVSLGYTGNIHMHGISGGGWTTCVIAAMDTRIGKSFPTIGDLPLAILLEAGAVSRDWEQLLADWLPANWDYTDLHILGACGTGRLSKQILYSDDPVFGGYHVLRQAAPYDVGINDRVTALGQGGAFKQAVFTHGVHEFDATVLSTLVLPEI